MRFKGVLMLASVAMILVATGIGNAFASTYPGEFVTVLQTDNSVALSYHSAGNLDVNAGDNLRWFNGFKNRHTSDATVDVTQSTNPSGGLDTNGDGIVTISGLTIPYTPPDGLGIYDRPVEYNVASAGSHTINSYHYWHYGGGNYWSPVNNQMTYY